MIGTEEPYRMRAEERQREDEVKRFEGFHGPVYIARHAVTAVIDVGPDGTSLIVSGQCVTVQEAAVEVWGWWVGA